MPFSGALRAEVIQHALALKYIIDKLVVMAITCRTTKLSEHPGVLTDAHLMSTYEQTSRLGYIDSHYLLDRSLVLNSILRLRPYCNIVSLYTVDPLNLGDLLGPPEHLQCSATYGPPVGTHRNPGYQNQPLSTRKV